MSIARWIQAVQDGNREQVAELLGAGTDVNGHGAEQEWSALNFAAGKGDLEMVELLVANGADVLQVGRDGRTPYKIALAAGRVEVARYLKQAEQRAGGDRDKISSRAGEDRPYCRAFRLADVRRFPGWSEDTADLGDDDVVFLHQNYVVTKTISGSENVIFDRTTPDWMEFCTAELKFKLPSDFDLVREPQTLE